MKPRSSRNAGFDLAFAREGEPLPMKWPWKLYCALLIAGGLTQMLRKVLTDTGGPSSRYAAVLFTAIVVAGLVAQSRERALGPRWFWQVGSAALVVGWLTMVAFALYLLAIEVDFAAGLLGLGAAPTPPGIAQLWIYAWRSPAVWNSDAIEAAGS